MRLETEPHQFWQQIDAAGTYADPPIDGYRVLYPARLRDGRQLALPIRERKQGAEALASLIINQVSFEVLDTLATELADRALAYAPDVVVGVPTLGLPLAQETARRLGHTRYVALSTSRKFWYDDTLSVALESITSPGQIKTLYLDPRMLPLVQGCRVALIDDVISTGASILAAYSLLAMCNVQPVVIGCAMSQTDRWRSRLAQVDRRLPDQVVSVFSSPLLLPAGNGHWLVPRVGP